MFSPTLDQSKPTALMRAAKSAPWLKSRWVTITLVQPWAERFRREFSRRPGRPRLWRCWLMRHTTERWRSAREAWRIELCASAQPPSWAAATETNDIDATNTATAVAARRAAVQARAFPRHSRAVSVSLIVDIPVIGSTLAALSEYRSRSNKCPNRQNRHPTRTDRRLIS